MEICTDNGSCVTGKNGIEFKTSKVDSKNNAAVSSNSKLAPDIFFPIQGVSVDAFRSELPLSPGSWTNYNANSGSNTHGMKININEKEIALFCYRNNFYAVDEKCPHLGGPLHLGDIEDMCSGDHNKQPCVICPWHKWTFNLKSGKQVHPASKNNQVQVYPVRTTSSGQISIGFSRIDPAYFSNWKLIDF